MLRPALTQRASYAIVLKGDRCGEFMRGLCDVVRHSMLVCVDKQPTRIVKTVGRKIPNLWRRWLGGMDPVNRNVFNFVHNSMNSKHNMDLLLFCCGFPVDFTRVIWVGPNSVSTGNCYPLFYPYWPNPIYYLLVPIPQPWSEFKNHSGHQWLPAGNNIDEIHQVHESNRQISMSIFSTFEWLYQQSFYTVRWSQY